VSTVWVRGQGDVLIRADFIVGFASVHGTLNAECANGRTVRLADSDRAYALQLALLDEIRRAAADDRHAVVIMAPAERDSVTWRREYADALVELLAASDDQLPVSPSSRQAAVAPAAADRRRVHGARTGHSQQSWPKPGITGS
jgi:hypothetical protein